jgi:hypothetical protein
MCYSFVSRFAKFINNEDGIARLNIFFFSHLNPDFSYDRSYGKNQLGKGKDEA